MMKVNFTVVIFFSFLLSVLYSKDFVFKVDGIDTTLGGDLKIGLFAKSDRDKFPGKKKEDLSYRQIVHLQNVDKKGAVEVHIPLEDLKEDEYVVTVFHDENSNEILDVNAIGIPKEGFGFSNNLLVLIFDSSLINVRKTVDKMMIIHMMYY